MSIGISAYYKCSEIMKLKVSINCPYCGEPLIAIVDVDLSEAMIKRDCLTPQEIIKLQEIKRDLDGR
jgi:hypothetical protein